MELRIKERRFAIATFSTANTHITAQWLRISKYPFKTFKAVANFFVWCLLNVNNRVQCYKYWW